MNTLGVILFAFVAIVFVFEGVSLVVTLVKKKKAKKDNAPKTDAGSASDGGVSTIKK